MRFANHAASLICSIIYFSVIDISDARSKIARLPVSDFGPNNAIVRSSVQRMERDGIASAQPTATKNNQNSDYYRNKEVHATRMNKRQSVVMVGTVVTVDIYESSSPEDDEPEEETVWVTSTLTSLTLQTSTTVQTSTQTVSSTVTSTVSARASSIASTHTTSNGTTIPIWVYAAIVAGLFALIVLAVVVYKKRKAAEEKANLRRAKIARLKLQSAIQRRDDLMYQREDDYTGNSFRYGPNSNAGRTVQPREDDYDDRSDASYTPRSPTRTHMW